jgi:hypothetical protein
MLIESGKLLATGALDQVFIGRDRFVSLKERD